MSFEQGLSGLNASSKSLDVIGNNISNAGIYGAKVARAEFANLYADAIGATGPGKLQIGDGVTVAAVVQKFSQGSITTTQNPLDLALNGQGFFQVQDRLSTAYTRNGQFKFDGNGFLVNSQQQKLLGISGGTLAPVQIPDRGTQAKASTAVSVALNLDSRATPIDAAKPISLTDTATYDASATVTVYGSAGQAVPLSLYLRKTASNEWAAYAGANGSSLSSSNGAPASVGTLKFNDSGVLTAPTVLTLPDIPLPAAADAAATPTGTAGTAAAAVPNTLSRLELRLGGVTQYQAPSVLIAASQDGQAGGSLVGVKVDEQGLVTASYSDGQARPVAQVQLANFRNPQGLQNLGGNGFAATSTSGVPTRGFPGELNFGSIVPSALEESNVDLTVELVDMITAQRVYQANSQSIKTQDQLLQTAVNLK